jgi:nuclear pore complex protein Nup107
VETLSLSRTEALCGYPFDFMHADAFEQDEAALYDHRKNLAGLALKNAIPHDKLPTPEEHADIVEQLRESSAAYYELQQLVRLLALFREWRAAEESVLASVVLFSTFSSSLRCNPHADSSQIPRRKAQSSSQ